MSELTVTELKKLFIYNQDTGVFTRLCDGRVMKSINGHGYCRIPIHCKYHAAHRLAWLYVFGDFPQSQIDHINRVRSDNRICNLRLASHKENGENRSLNVNTSSGVRGVTWNKSANKWQAQIKSGKNLYLGVFSTIHDAEQAYLKAASELHTRNSCITKFSESLVVQA